MSFDDLFALLIVVVFIGLPLLNRLRGGAQPPGAPPRAPGRPGDPRTGRAPGGAPPGRTAEGDDGERDDRAPMDELSRRLEEARRRVREAMGEDQGSAREAPRPLVSAQPTSAPSSAGRNVASAGIPSGTAKGAPRPATTVAQPQTRTPPPPATFKRTGTGTGRRPGLARATPALEVERSAGRGAAGSAQERARRARARTESATLVSMDGASIRKGILWHMILGQPAAYGRGRMRSPRRSP
ncbi:hypothetical protein BH23DEI1_BH23DEI1_02360 [soil metagenome]